jgi:hypothetical protein
MFFGALTSLTRSAAARLAPLYRSVVWVNGALQALPEGLTDWRDVDREVSFMLAQEHQFLQVCVYVCVVCACVYTCIRASEGGGRLGACGMCLSAVSYALHFCVAPHIRPRNFCTYGQDNDCSSAM